MLDTNLNKSNIERYMKDIKDLLLKFHGNEKLYWIPQIKEDQKNYLQTFNPNSKEIKQFNEILRDPLRYFKDEAVNTMKEILVGWINIVKQNTKEDLTINQIIGDNWENNLTYFNDIQKIKDNIDQKLGDTKSTILRLDNSTNLFKYGFYANKLLSYCPNDNEGDNDDENFFNLRATQSFLNNTTIIVGDIIQNEEEEEENYTKNQKIYNNSNDESKTEEYDFNNIFTILQNNEKTRIKNPIHPINYSFDSYFKIDGIKSNQPECEKSIQPENSKEDAERKLKEEAAERVKKIKAYKAAYMKRYREKFAELIQKKREEAKQNS